MTRVLQFASISHCTAPLSAVACSVWATTIGLLCVVRTAESYLIQKQQALCVGDVVYEYLRSRQWFSCNSVWTAFINSEVMLWSHLSPSLSPYFALPLIALLLLPPLSFIWNFFFSPGNVRTVASVATVNEFSEYVIVSARIFLYETVGGTAVRLDGAELSGGH